MEFESLFRRWKAVDEMSAGSVIFAEGDPAADLFVILEGEVELTLRDKPLATEKAGGIIGVMAVLEAATRNATATARTDVRLARMTRAQASQLMDEHVDFAKRVMAVLAHRLRDVDRFITHHVTL